MAISLGRPRWAIRYTVAAEIDELKPWGLLGLDSDPFVAAYRRQLDLLDLQALTEKFEAIGAQHDRRPLVFLCFENVHAGHFCHRRLASAWLEAELGITVPEIEPAQLQLPIAPDEGEKGPVVR